MRHRFRDVLRTATFRLTFAHLAAFGVLLSALLGFVYFRTVNELERQVETILAHDLAALLEAYDQEGRVGLIAVVDRRSRGSGVRLYLLADAQLRQLAGNLTQWPADLPPIDGQHRFTAQDSGAEPGPSRPARGIVSTLENGERLLVAQDLTEREAFRDLIARSIGWGLAVALAFGLLEGWLLSRFMLRRVDAVGRFSAGVVPGEMRARLPIRGTGDEFDRLALEINGLLDRIERLVTSQRELADNVAHDLRRPFTRLKARLELLLSREHDLDACRRVARETVAEADGILRTFDMLLRIARTEAGAIEEQFARLDLGAVVAEVVELYGPLAKEQGVVLETRIAPGIAVHGVRELLAQAIANLVDNAVKFSASGDTVRITVSAGHHTAWVTVADEGPGIPAADRERVLQRFVQLDASRSRPGSGLGLTLVAATARVHKARLELADSAPGLRVELEFPRASD